MDLELKGKVVIVTGAAGGIGRGIAQVMGAEGAKVAIADINLEGAIETADLVKAAGGKAIAMKTDVTDMDAVMQMVKRVEAELGKIDILINNAGQTLTESRQKFFWERTTEQSNAIVGMSLLSVMNCCRAVIKDMLERRSGKILNIASVAGIIGDVKSSEYSASKAGVIGFTRVLAKETAAYGININSISPGPIFTPGMKKAPAELVEKFKRQSGMGRLGKPEDIGYMAAFLVSDKANYINGHDHVVGGLMDIGGNGST